MDALDRFDALAKLARQEPIPHCNVSHMVLSRLRRDGLAPVLSMQRFAWFAVASAAAVAAVLAMVVLLSSSSSDSSPALAMLSSYELFWL